MFGDVLEMINIALANKKIKLKQSVHKIFQYHEKSIVTMHNNQSVVTNNSEQQEETTLFIVAALFQLPLYTKNKRRNIKLIAEVHRHTYCVSPMLYL